MQNNEVNVLERLKARAFDLVRHQQVVAAELQQLSQRISEMEKLANDNKNGSHNGSDPKSQTTRAPAPPVGTRATETPTGPDGGAN